MRVVPEGFRISTLVFTSNVRQSSGGAAASRDLDSGNTKLAGTVPADRRKMAALHIFDESSQPKCLCGPALFYNPGASSSACSAIGFSLQIDSQARSFEMRRSVPSGSSPLFHIQDHGSIGRGMERWRLIRDRPGTLQAQGAS